MSAQRAVRWPSPLPRPDGIVGYAPGAYDLFHVGHLNLLRRAWLRCDHLIAGVVSDEVALRQKGRLPVVPELERLAVVQAMDVVDDAVLELTTDKLLTWRSVRFDVVFKGDDWRGSPTWTALEERFARVGVRVEYLPYTEHTSTTKLRAATAEAAHG
ncbi:MAG: adenylyltransferase/cytidyltransferase family protein [Actinomycetota bacterium]|nr:adenylyltransferase/cytidyltransferase family protein [Actinomycetota bacterium]